MTPLVALLFELGCGDASRNPIVTSTDTMNEGTTEYMSDETAGPPDSQSGSGETTDTSSSSGDGDADPSTSGDGDAGDGDPSTSAGSGDGDAGDSGDGDPSTSSNSGDGDPGNGDGDPGNGDGDPGNGDGDPGNGDGDLSTSSGSGDGDGDPGTSSNSGDGDPSTSFGSGDGDGGDGDPTTSSGDGDGDEDPCTTFLGCPDLGTPPVTCDPWLQDCMPGEKCTPVNLTTTPGYEAYHCVEAGDQPPGEPCIEFSSPKGSDSCDETSVCINIDPATNLGTCHEYCTGSPGNGACTQSSQQCVENISALLHACLDTCSPLLNGSCGTAQGCYATYEGTDVDGFICYATADEGIQGDTCECSNCCADGYFCADAADYGDAWCNGIYCCTPHCDLNAADEPCVVPGQQCVPLFDPTHPEYADVGACLSTAP